MPRTIALAVLTMLAACSAPPEQTPTVGAHDHRVATLVTFTPNGLSPGPEVHIPPMSTVVWRNQLDEPLDIDVVAASCPSCETVYGFVAGHEGAGCRSVGPGAVASLCFHQQGRFPFVGRAGHRELRGTIVVGAPR